ncbi:tetratricopeptide repeat protein [Sphingobium chlorophenolicum]|uniref:tetratricopeptide repeat protein n=2 Tax=Sphingobium chlorophenolicum TaxID=46429 RepID=UPI000AE5DC65|nr:tetratricopeptide repeat protein [Sphingobium chlorophenolicum]
MRWLLAALLMGAAPALAEEAPDMRGLYLQLIHQARSDGRPRAALAYLDDFERRYPGDVEARLLRVNSLIDLGQIDAAEAVPLPGGVEDGGVGAVRGHLLAARGRWAEAAAFYERAGRGRPADALLRNAWGYALLRAGRAEAAIEALRGASDLAPGDAVIRNNLMLALLVGGRRVEAEAGLRRVDAALRRRLLSEAARVEAGR